VQSEIVKDITFKNIWTEQIVRRISTCSWTKTILFPGHSLYKPAIALRK
jgi:hypothetical protein